MASRCRKFQPNVFNKLKCQHCFGQKDLHSAEALENFKEARKISKAGYLFVAPELDFSNPLDRSKRWQRRFFVLYDDGELVYLVDENPDTVPQERINMNKCCDVLEVEELTSHPFSIAVVSPEKRHYMKGTSQDEIRRWFDVLVMYPRSLKIKHKRLPTCPVKTPLPQQQYGGVGGSATAAGEQGTPGSAEDSPQSPVEMRPGGRSKYRSDPGFSDGVSKSRSLHDVPGYEELQQRQRAVDARRVQKQRAEGVGEAAIIKSRSGILQGAQLVESDDDTSTGSSEDEELEEAGDVLSILRHGTTGKPDLWKPTAVASASLAARRRQERETGRASLSPFTRSALALLSSSFPSYDDTQSVSTAPLPQLPDNDTTDSTDSNLTDESKIASSCQASPPHASEHTAVSKKDSTLSENFRTPPERLSPPVLPALGLAPASPPRSSDSESFHTPAVHEQERNPFVLSSHMDTVLHMQQKSRPTPSSEVSEETDAMVRDLLEAQLSAVKSQLSAVQQEVILLRERNLSLNAQVKAGLEGADNEEELDPADKLQSEVEALRTELRVVRSQLQRHVTQLDESCAQREVKERRLREVEARLSTSEALLQQERLKTGRWTEDWRKQVQEYERRSEEAGAGLRQREAALQQRQQELAALRLELEQSKLAEQEASAQAAVSASLQTSSAHLQHTCDSLREQLAQVQQAHSEAVSEAEARAAKYQREKARLAERLAEAERRLLALRSPEEGGEENVAELLADKDLLISQLEDKLTETEEELGTEVEEHQRESAALKLQLRELNDSGAIEDVAHQDKLAVLEETLKERDVALSRLRAIVTDLEQRVDRARPAEVLQDQYDEAMSEVTSLRARCAALEQQLHSRICEGGRVPQAVSTLLSRVERTRKPLSRLLEGLAAISHQPEMSADMKHELSVPGVELRQLLDKAVRGARRARRDVKELAGTCSELQTGLTEFKHNWLNSRAQHRAQLSALSQQLGELARGQPASLEAPLTELAAGLQALSAINEASAPEEDASGEGSVCSSSGSSHEAVLGALPSADVCRMLVDSMAWLRTAREDQVTPRSPDVHVTQLQAGLGVCRDSLQKALPRLDGCALEVRRLVSESLQVCRACLAQHGPSEPRPLGDHLSLVAAYVQSQLALYARLCCRQLSAQPHVWGGPAARARLRDLRVALQRTEQQLLTSPAASSQAASSGLAALLNSYAENTVSKLNALCSVIAAVDGKTPASPLPADGDVSEDSVTTRSSSQEETDGKLEPSGKRLRRLKRDTEKLRKQLQLAQAALENANIYHDMEMERIDGDHEQELDDLCEKHESEVEILRKALREAKRRLGPESDDIMDIATLKFELEKSKSQLEEFIKEEQADEDSVAYYKHKLEEQAEEIKGLKTAHKRELEQVQQDIVNVMKLMREADEAEDDSNAVARLKQELERQRQKHAEETQQLLHELSKAQEGAEEQAQIQAPSAGNETSQLEKKMRLMQESYESELNKVKETSEKEVRRSCDDQITVLQAAEVNQVLIDEAAVRSKYLSEIQQLKAQCSLGLEALGQSHRRALKEMRRAQQQELQLLRSQQRPEDGQRADDNEGTEQEEPIEALKKAHNSELAAERIKLQKNIACMYTESEVKAMKTQLQAEVSQLQSSLDQRVTELSAVQQLCAQQQQALSAARAELQAALAQHEAHLAGLRREVEQLRHRGAAGPEDSLPELKLQMKAQELELEQARHQIASLCGQLKVMETFAGTERRSRLSSGSPPRPSADDPVSVSASADGLLSPSASSDTSVFAETPHPAAERQRRRVGGAGASSEGPGGGRQRSPSPARRTAPNRGRTKLAAAANVASKKEKRQRDFRRSKSSPGFSLGELSRAPRPRTASLANEPGVAGNKLLLGLAPFSGVSVAERMRKFEQ